MLMLSLLWLALGPCCALLVLLARKQASYRYRITPLPLLLLESAALALVMGWLGTWLFGRITATACVLWGVPCGTWVLSVMERRRYL
jgi:hypothetical protein